MTIDFHETEAEELARLREEDLYKKNLISRLLSRHSDKNALLLECAEALKKVGEHRDILEGDLLSLASRAWVMVGKSDDREESSKSEKRTKRNYDSAHVGDEYVVYRLTYDTSLNKTLPCGHEFIGRYSSLEEANKIL